MRIQIAYRETGPIRESSRRFMMCTGIVEVPLDLFATEHVNYLKVEKTDDEGKVILHPTYRSVSTGRESPAGLAGSLRACDIGDAVTRIIWAPLAVPGAGAMLFVRDCRIAPESHDSLVQIFSGLMPETGHDFQSPHYIHHFEGDPDRFEYQGRVGIEVLPGRELPDIVEATRGSTLSSFLKQPWWGFEGNPICLRSTMHLAVIDLFDEFDRLQFQDDLTPDQEARRDELAPIMQSMGLASRRVQDSDVWSRDAQYTEYRQRLDAALPDRPHLSMPATAADILDSEALASRILREMQDDVSSPASRSTP